MTSLPKFLIKRIWLISLSALVISSATPILRAQDVPLPGDFPPRVKKRKPKPDVLPTAPTQPPSFAIPVGPLGYGLPSPTYLGRRYSLFSLDFLDDNHILFSLRAPGLLSREASEAAGARQVKAVVLDLPGGKVASEGLWTIPDRGRYLWMLSNGRFLLRDREGLKIGDQGLGTKPLLPLSGEFQSLQIDPGGKAIVVHTLEGTGSNPIVTRVVQLDTGQIEQTTRGSSLAEPTINAEGSLEFVHESKYDQWSLKLTGFSGSSKVLGHVESTCLPDASFISNSEIIVAGCDTARVPKLADVSVSGQILWQSESPLSYLPPLLLTTPDGERFARESILLRKKPNPGTAITWVKAVRGQAVRVFDSATGRIVFEAPVSPVLDGGGNIALSPSGRRIAILNNGSIQIFELPLPQTR